MRYTLKNIRGLIKNEKFVFVIMIVCVFVSAWSMLFSYGSYHNYAALRDNEENKGTSVSPHVMEGRTLTRVDVVNYLIEISPKTLAAIRNIVVNWVANLDESNQIMFTSRFIVRDKTVQPSPYIVQHWNDNNMILSGRYISDSEEANGEKVVMIAERAIQKKAPYLTDHNTAVFNGEEYTIVGTHNSNSMIIPLLTFPEDAGVMFSMYFEKQVTRKQYEELVNVAERVLPGMFTFEEPEFTDKESVYIYNNMMIVSVLIAALTVINFAFLYSFILQRRARTLAVMRICGCTKGRAWLICMGECCLICIPVFIIGVLTYIPFMSGVLTEAFEYIEQAYSPAVYAILFAIYAVTLLVIMGVTLARQMDRELAEGRKGGRI